MWHCTLNSRFTVNVKEFDRHKQNLFEAHTHFTNKLGVLRRTKCTSIALCGNTEV